MARSSFFASAIGIAFVWSSSAFAQPQAIEPVEAQTMTKSGAATAAKNGSVKMTRTQDSKQVREAQIDASKGGAAAGADAPTGDAKQQKAQKSDAATGNAKGDAKQQKAQKSDAATGNAKGDAKQQKAQKSDAATGNAKGDAKQTRIQDKDAKGAAAGSSATKQGGSSPLRDATRSQDRLRTRDQLRDHSGSGDRGANARGGERRHSETAEHRQEQRGNGAGAGARTGSGAMGSGNGAGPGRN